MSIRVDPVVDVEPLSLLSEFMVTFPGYAFGEIRSDLERNVTPTLLSELRYYPGASVHPYTFGSDRSKRYYFWAVNEGLIKTDGNRYIRTQETANAWSVEVIEDEESLALVSENTKKSTRYVTGNRQVRGHARTGWVKHSETINFWALVAVERSELVIKRLIETGPTE